MEVQQQSYYQKNKEQLKQKAQEYYHKLSEGRVSRRNNKREPIQEDEPKRSRGRPRVRPIEIKGPVGRPKGYKKPTCGYVKKQILLSDILDMDAFMSPEDSRDIIFEDMVKNIIVT